MRRFLCAVAIVLLAFGQTHADITFNFNYVDVNTNSGFGFDDAAEGATRRATVQSVADYINTVVDHNGTVDITWNASINDSGSSVLGSMGSFYFQNAGIANGFVFDHATTGVDPLGGFDDGSGQINFGKTWNSDLGAPTAGEFDLFTVVLHEMTHALGFASLFNSSGGTEILGTRSVYDSLIEDGSGNRLLSGTSFVGNASDFTGGDLHIDVGSTTLELYAPGTFLPGSSVSHFDFSVSGDNIMFPGIAAGTANRAYSENDRLVLAAIGWNVVPIPEPGCGVILCITGVVFVVGRRRKNLV